MKKEYMKPQMQVVKVNLSSLICESQLNFVGVDKEGTMREDEEFE